MPAIV